MRTPPRLTRRHAVSRQLLICAVTSPPFSLSSYPCKPEKHLSSSLNRVTMCICYMLHQHHLAECPRPLSYVLTYTYCPAAYINPATHEAMSPCPLVLFEPAISEDQDPCAIGGCLLSPDCASGACRLQDLNGQWVCCKCRRGGNMSKWCRHRRKGSPDTFCYHNICSDCKADK